MSRMVLYLARTIPPPAVSTTVQVYGIDEGNPVTATVIDVDEQGVTVELGTAAHGTRRWHVDFPWAQ